MSELGPKEPWAWSHFVNEDLLDRLPVGTLGVVGQPETAHSGQRMVLQGAALTEAFHPLIAKNAPS